MILLDVQKVRKAVDLIRSGAEDVVEDGDGARLVAIHVFDAVDGGFPEGLAEPDGEALDF